MNALLPVAPAFICVHYNLSCQLTPADTRPFTPAAPVGRIADLRIRAHAGCPSRFGVNLQRAGYEVVSATSADEAAELLEHRDDVQLIVTDINLTGSMNGLKLAAAVKARPEMISSS